MKMLVILSSYLLFVNLAFANPLLDLVNKIDVPESGLYQNNNISLAIRSAFVNAEILSDKTLSKLPGQQWTCLRVTPLYGSTEKENRKYFPQFTWLGSLGSYSKSKEMEAYLNEYPSTKREGSICTVQVKESLNTLAIDRVINEIKLNSVADIRSEVPQQNLQKMIVKQYSCTERDSGISDKDQKFFDRTKDKGLVIQLESCFLISE